MLGQHTDISEEALQRLSFGSAKQEVNDTDYSFGFLGELKTKKKKTSTSVSYLFTSDHAVLQKILKLHVHYSL